MGFFRPDNDKRRSRMEQLATQIGGLLADNATNGTSIRQSIKEIESLVGDIRDPKAPKIEMDTASLESQILNGFKIISGLTVASRTYLYIEKTIAAKMWMSGGKYAIIREELNLTPDQVSEALAGQSLRQASRALRMPIPALAKVKGAVGSALLTLAFELTIDLIEDEYAVSYYRDRIDALVPIRLQIKQQTMQGAVLAEQLRWLVADLREMESASVEDKTRKIAKRRADWESDARQVTIERAAAALSDLDKGLHAWTAEDNLANMGLLDLAQLGWTFSSTGNIEGAWQTQVRVPTGRPATGIVVKEQGGYGIINAQLLYDQEDGKQQETAWTCNNQETQQNHSQRMPGERITKVQVKEQGGYGVVDLRFVTESGKSSRWLTNNPDGVERETIEIPEGNMLVGLRGKEQGRYGLVDFRFAFAPVPQQGK